MRRKYDEVKKDYYRLKEICGGNDIDDYCGAWCNNDKMNQLLNNPTKATAAELFSELITAYHTHGYKTGLDYESITKLNLMDSEVHAILVRNGDI